MNRKISLVTALLLFAFILTGNCQAQDSGTFMVGAAKVDITPDPGELATATDMIRDHLYVRAIYMDDGTNPAVLVSVAGHLQGIDEALQKSSASTGCPVENYLVTETHSHSASTGSRPDSGSSHPSSEEITEAIVSAVDMAKSRLAPARVGFGTTQVDLNVNRDNFDEWMDWRQTQNWDGPSDKTLSVLEFLGEDDVPIAVYYNYGMHPVNFFLSGVISADFPGDASTYIEELFDNKTVAVFSQGTAGDQNPKMSYTSIFQEGPVKAVLPPHNVTGTGNQPPFTGREAVPDDELAAYKKTVALKSDYVHMLGTMIGNSAVRVMLYDTEFERNPTIWAGKQNVVCPGRVRIDTEGRENYDPGYEDGPDITIGVGLLRIGNINLVSVSGEVYTEIGLRVKEQSPASKTVFISIAHGPRGSGYIYSNNASYHQTFQVIGSRLKPGCAEPGIVAAALDLMEKADKSQHR